MFIKKLGYDIDKAIFLSFGKYISHTMFWGNFLAKKLFVRVKCVPISMSGTRFGDLDQKCLRMERLEIAKPPNLGPEKCPMIKTRLKILHTGDKASLNQCG